MSFPSLAFVGAAAPGQMSLGYATTRATANALSRTAALATQVPSGSSGSGDILAALAASPATHQLAAPGGLGAVTSLGRRNSSTLQAWFQNPTWVSSINPTTADTASVAITLGLVPASGKDTAPAQFSYNAV